MLHGVDEGTATRWPVVAIELWEGERDFKCQDINEFMEGVDYDILHGIVALNVLFCGLEGR